MRKPAEIEDGEEEIKTFGLGLSGHPNISDRKAAQAALEIINGAMSTIRSAYRELTRDRELEALLAKGGAAGQAPAHMLAKIANYQEALARLGG